MRDATTDTSKSLDKFVVAMHWHSKYTERLPFQIAWRVAIATLIITIIFILIFVVATRHLISADATNSVTSLIESVKPFAAIAAYSTSKFSADAALSLVHGSPWIGQAQIVDNFGHILSNYQNQALLSDSSLPRVQQAVPLRLEGSETIYGTLLITVAYGNTHFATFFIYSGLIAIIATGLSLGFVLLRIFHIKCLTPLGELKCALVDLPNTSRPDEFVNRGYGSVELNNLSTAFQSAWTRSHLAIAEKNDALFQRGILADAVNHALQGSGIFFVVTGLLPHNNRTVFGEKIPPELNPIIDTISENELGINTITPQKFKTVAFKRSQHYSFDRKDDGRHHSFMETTLRDGRVWALTYINLQQQRHAVLGTEITELKRFRDEAEAVQRLDAIGVLASGVAHDFNNVLAIIIASIELQRQFSDPLPQRLHNALEAAKRGAQLARRLLDASKDRQQEPDAIEPAKLVPQVQRELADLLGDKYELDCRIETDARVIAEPDQLQTTLVNLILNARDASPPFAKIDLLVRNASKQELVGSGLDPTRAFVLFSITDRGTGISEEMLPRTFEPFFTTKERGQGTGLGLTLARSFTQRSEGKLNVQSKLGEGTVVTFLLPAVEELNATGAACDSASDPSKPIKGRKVLIVEDQPALLACLLDMVEINGGIPNGASGLREALLMIDDENSKFDIIISDVVLPDGSGIKLLDHKIERQLQTPIILMGGNFDVETLNSAQSEAMKAYLKKPFSLDEFVKGIAH